MRLFIEYIKMPNRALELFICRSC